MSDLLKTGADWLASTMKGNASQSVTYHRDGHTAATLSATIGSSDFEALQTDGTVTQQQSRDFIVQRADLVLSGSEVEPVRGDEIKQTADDGTTIHVYEVIAPAGGPPWKWADRYFNRRRIHTKHVRTE